MPGPYGATQSGQATGTGFTNTVFSNPKMSLKGA